MKLLSDKAQVRDTGIKQSNYYKAAPVFTKYEEREVDCGYGEYSNQTKFQLKLTVGVEFFANQAQYPTARRCAEQCLVKELFKDSRTWLAYARKAIMDGDPSLAIDFLGRLEKEMEA